MSDIKDNINELQNLLILYDTQLIDKRNLVSNIKIKNVDVAIDKTETQINDLLMKTNELLKLRKAMKAKNTEEQTMIQTELNTYRKQLMQITQNYYVLKESHIEKAEETIRRQYKIVKPDATQSELDDLIKNTKLSEVNVFAGSMLATTSKNQNQEATELYQSIIDRHNEIMKLENSIKYVKQLFIDNQVLVQNQGEILIEIENNLDQTIVRLEEGNLNLTQAKRYQRSARKKTCCIFITVIMVLGIVLTVVIVPIVKLNK